MYVDPINAVVEVAFAKGSIYQYTNVSRRAILNLLVNPLISLGMWVNHNLTAYDSRTKCIKLHPMDALMYQSPSFIH